MSLSGPLNIWGQSAGVSGPPLPLPARPRPRHRAPYLDLLDFVLDPLDGVPVYVIPRIHLLGGDSLCSDHCNRGCRAQQGWWAPEELPCPCPCRGPCGAPGATAPCGTTPLLPHPTGAPRTHPAARGAAVTHGAQRDSTGTRSTLSGGGHGKVWEQGSGSSRPPCTQQRGRSVRPCPLLHHAARELCPCPAPGVPR